MSRRRSAVVGGMLSLLLVAAAPVAHAGEGTDAGAQPPGADADGRPPAAELSWAACGATPVAIAADVECARAPLPLDHGEPHGATVELAVVRVPATDPDRRIGPLFVNFGGPGGPAVDYFQLLGPGIFGALNQHFDIVGFDPRGVGQSTPAIDCGAPPAPGAPDLPTPGEIDLAALVEDARAHADACLAANGEVLAHLSTANAARDMDALRVALGEEQITYFGYSYGTLLGATYAALFPDRYRALVLDGAIDPERYLGDPLADAAGFMGGFEDALDRFLEACATDQVACSGFGGSDPAAAYDDLLARAESAPIPAPGFPEDPTPVTADEIRFGTFQLLYAKQNWSLLAEALAAAELGDATLLRELVAVLLSAGSPSPDAFTAITAVDQEWPTDVADYLAHGEEEYAQHPHFWWLGGPSLAHYAFWPVEDDDAFRGPFTVEGEAPPVLVIGTTHDPATPFEDAVALTEQLGNARLLTMEGDGHTAYGGNSACVDSVTDSYLVAVTLPLEGTVCPQEVPFGVPGPVPTDAAALAAHRPVAVVVAAGPR